MFSKFFIQRPIFATVLAVVMVLAGIMAGLSLPIAQFPDITPPTIFVSSSYPGADAETLARTVAEPIEAQVNGVEGMIYMSSTSSSDGQYSLTVTFENGTDIDQAAVDVQNRISQIDATLPEAVKQQGMNVMKRSSNMLLFISIDADSTAGKAYDALYLTNYAQLHLTEPLSRVEGVGNVSAFGGGDYDMRIWLKPEVMKIRGVSASEVQQAIESQNLHVSAGSVGQSPGAGGASFEYTLTADGELNDTEQFRNIIIRTDPDGSVLHLRDIADVELGSSSYSQIARVNGKQTTLIGISQLPGANALETADGALKELDRLSKYFPEGVTYNVINNSTDYVRESIKEVGVTFLETTAIVMLVILLFLQNWRAVIIPMITIPVSLIATLAVMKLFGFTLNTLTLFGLVLAIAIVVDDAIVVVEDCMRILDEGKLNRVQAAEQAMKELTGPVVGEVLVLLSVFIPTAFISGITGQLYKQFALTIAVSTAFSGFNALTLTPALCALFLKPSTPKKNLIYRGFNKVWGKVEGFYGATVSKMLRRAGAWTIAFIAAALAGVYLYTKYPSSYLPEEDMGYCIASLQLPTGATLDRTEKVMQTLERSFKQEIPAIKDIMTISGISMMGGGDNSNSGSIFVMLKPWNQRGKGESVEDVMAQMTEIAYRVQQEGVFFAANPPSIPGLGSSSGMQMQILDINSLGADALANAVQTMEQSLQATGNYSRVNSMYESGVPQYRIVVDRDRAALRGLAIEDIYSALSAFTGGAYTGQINDFGHTFQVTVQATGDARRTVESLNALSVPNSKGEMVPFSAFADVKAVEGLPSVSRYNMYTTADLTAIPKAESAPLRQ